ncbi:MAG: VOC family protein [Armatimonadetes bacterium]|nr:VOC family protein [Armatimonadota bacterium]
MNALSINDDLKSALELPDVSQIAMVVHGVERVIEYYETVFGLGPFVRPSIRFTEMYCGGEPIPVPEWKLAFCSLGPVELEFIEPVTGPQYYFDFLEEKGEGLHHIAFDVKDLDSRLAHCKQVGIDVLFMARTEQGGCAHLDIRGTGGAIVEIVQRPGRRA